MDKLEPGESISLIMTITKYHPHPAWRWWRFWKRGEYLPLTEVEKQEFVDRHKLQGDKA